MNCYCHPVKNSGALTLLNPDAPGKKVMSVEDESVAIASFHNLPS